MAITQPRPRRVKPLDAGPFAPEIGSFRLHLAAEGKAPKTVRTYVEAVAWFAAAHLIERTRCTQWDEVSCHDVQRWLVHLLTRYSDAYASNQFRALQQFFRWLADEEQLADPMAGLRAPKVREKLVPVFTSEELSALAKACQGRSFGQRRDAAIFAVLTATGIRAGSWPGSATTRTTPAAVIWICGPGRSLCAVRAARRGWSGSATRLPVRWTGICGCGPGMVRRGGASCGWG
jgi:site-specific recombinase XerC